MAKSLEDIQKEYNLACAQLGQEVYRVAALEMEIGMSEKNIGSLKQRLKELNEAAAKAARKQEEASSEQSNQTQG